MPPIKIDIDDSLSAPSSLPERAKELQRIYAERHLALSDAMAVALSELEQKDIPATQPFWGRGFVRAGEIIGMVREFGGSRFWKDAVPVFHDTVVAPILRHAMDKCGAVVLPGFAALRNATAENHAFNDVIDHARLTEFVDLAMDDLDVMGAGFWAEVSVNLYCAARHSAETRTGRFGRSRDAAKLLPDIDPLAARLMLMTDPELPPEAEVTKRKLKPNAVSHRKRSGIHPKEGGVAGIRVSSQLEDFPDAVGSELILPSELLANRLLHEGLLVRHRPPFQQPKRDILAVTLCDSRSLGDGAFLLKAAWADASIRLRFLLNQLGVGNSDLLWAEATELGVNVAHIPVQGLKKSLRNVDAFLLSGAMRKKMFFETQLLPEFINQLPSAGRRMEAIEDTQFTSLSALLADRSLTSLRRGGKRGPKKSDPATSPADYAKVIVFVLLPEGSEEALAALADWNAFERNFRQEAKLPFSSGFTLQGVILPKDLFVGAEFFVSPPDTHSPMEPITLEEDEDNLATTNQWIGQVSWSFMRSVLGAINV
ncbi:hypothetical protein TL5118_04165 [Thalassovita autumnalis]|jgi:hypothetical protein|uniref:Uncharacterized protein n=1 Tax=Thalassovita autumnalis TaxID=2072972 RepID=A0A0P1GCV3_9RHOB|nr:hypothetical protein [Thalassovita autumnalis]CUH70190.1 hypothetical protein TL5118_04165 [Thalassovita autumnalis]CUH71880.1 hypothetical protein TL5120_01672 [Thalassovita autumnalis]